MDIFGLELNKSLFFCRFHSRLKRPSNDDEQIIKSDSPETNQLKAKRRSTNLSSSFVPIEIQQQTSMDESNVGIPSRFCSVCGDISTGNYLINLSTKFIGYFQRNSFRW
jgi:hypothetical protein